MAFKPTCSSSTYISQLKFRYLDCQSTKAMLNNNIHETATCGPQFGCSSSTPSPRLLNSKKQSSSAFENECYVVQRERERLWPCPSLSYVYHYCSRHLLHITEGGNSAAISISSSITCSAIF